MEHALKIMHILLNNLQIQAMKFVELIKGDSEKVEGIEAKLGIIKIF